MKLTSTALTTIGFSALLTASSHAVLLAGQGFENEATPGALLIDTNPADHLLADSATANVTSAGAGAELGFTARYTPTAARSGGLNALGVNLGVATAAQISGGDVGANWSGAFSDASSNGYVVSDTDGLFTFTLDAADLAFAVNVVFSFDLQFSSNNWESTDTALISLITDQGTTVLLDLSNGDTLDLGTTEDYAGNSVLKGEWANISIAIPDAVTTATFQIQLDSNSGQEALIFDNIQFNGDSLIPEPSSALLLLGSTALLFGRRRK